MRRAGVALKSPIMSPMISPYKGSANRPLTAIRKGFTPPCSRNHSVAAETHPGNPAINYTQLFGQRYSNRSECVPMERLAQSLAKRGGNSERLSRENQSRPVRKRKRQETRAENAPQSRRLRVPNKSLDYDVEAIRRKLNVPTKETFPGISDEILVNPKGYLLNIMQKLGKIETLFDVFGKKYHRCVLRCNFKHADPIDAIGEGINVKLADKAAFLHLLAKFNDKGILQEMLGITTKIDTETLTEEKDAKIDVYNYAARYGTIPRISVSTESRSISGKTHYEVTVEMPEHGIKVAQKSRQLIHAEIGAFVMFKEEAERYQSSKGSASLIVNDSKSLTNLNARQFFQFYKNVEGGVGIEVVFLASGHGTHQAQVELDGEPIGALVEEKSKKRAEDLAYLTAALHIVQGDPNLLPNFLKALRAGNGQILRLLAPVTMDIQTKSLNRMEDALRSAKAVGLADQSNSLEADEELSRERRYRAPPSVAQMELRSEKLLDKHHLYQTREDLEELRRKRADLPMSQYSNQVLDLVSKNTYSIIIGATGSGKTTQVPQIILEQAIRDQKGGFCRVICTQPRRIAAISVAKRVAEERAEPLRDAVGYHVRQDAKLPKDAGSITYCTTGILLQQLQHSPDEILDCVSHLVIDEVHERDMVIDFLLVVLKKAMASRLAMGQKVPKVILMSATMDSKLFASYFQSSGALGNRDCPTLSVPGRTFPVREQYLDDIVHAIETQHRGDQLQVMHGDKDTKSYLSSEKACEGSKPLAHGELTKPEIESAIDWKKTSALAEDGEPTAAGGAEEGLVPLGLVATTIAHIAKTTDEGAILVFLPGIDEIVKVNDLLCSRKILGIEFGDDNRYKTYMLHSSLQGDQQGVFEPVPNGCRKIILGTNIAETSITIPEVQYVVDSGKLREKRYDQLRRITKLQCTWISKSNSKQRAGRAGRVQNGHYYALFSKSRFESLRAIGLPELLRSDLQETCLQVKSQAMKAPIREFLGDAIEPPAPTAVDAAVNNLVELDALTEDEKLTSLGRLLASLPVHPSLGKMIVLGIIFRCLDPMIILGAISAERPLFVSPPDSRSAAQRAKRELASSSNSDHLALLNAFNQLRRLQRQDLRQFQAFAHRNFIHMGAFKRIQSTSVEIEGILADAGLISRSKPADLELGDELLNENSGNLQMIKALTIAGLRTNIAVATGEKTHRTQGEQNCLLHPSSVNAPKNREENAYSRRMETNQIYAYSILAKSNDGNSTSLRETTQVTPLMAALFGGHLSGSSSKKRVVTIDGWLPFYVSSTAWNGAETIKSFRKALDLVQREAFRDLSKRQYLAGDEARKIFAECLVSIFDGGTRPQWAVRAARGEAEDYQPPDPWNKIDHYEPSRRPHAASRYGYDRQPAQNNGADQLKFLTNWRGREAGTDSLLRGGR